MHYQRGAKAKDSDIPHRTRLTVTVKERAQEIEAELQLLLKVRAFRLRSNMLD